MKKDLLLLRTKHFITALETIVSKKEPPYRLCSAGHKVYINASNFHGIQPGTKNLAPLPLYNCPECGTTIGYKTTKNKGGK